MKKEIHIWDLPSEKVYIQLKDNYREAFFDKAYKKFNNWRLLGEHLKIKRGDTIIARNWKQGKCCYPLSITLKLLTTFLEELSNTTKIVSPILRLFLVFSIPC
mgnify:CR=1 FL=1